MSGLVASVRISINGSEVKDFVDFKVQQSIYGPNRFEVRFRPETFESSHGFLIQKSKSYLNQSIVIEIERYSEAFKSSEPAFFFKGLITDVAGSRSGLGEQDFVILSGYSPDFVLMDNPGCTAMFDTDVKQMVEKVLSASGIRYKLNMTENIACNWIVKYSESSYDFLRRMAVRYGQWFYYDGAVTVFGTPTGKSVPLVLGHNLLDFRFSAGMRSYLAKFAAFDRKTARIESGFDGGASSDQLNEYGLYACNQSFTLFQEPGLIENLSQGSPEKGYTQLLKKASTLYKDAATAKMEEVTGTSINPMVMLGGKIKVEGVADFGEYLVKSIVHSCDIMKNYRNEFTCMPGKAKVPDYTDPTVYRHCEPQMGTVTDHSDPEGLGRVRVKLPWMDSGSKSHWMPVLYPHAGKGYGFLYRPEIGDEVMVGFEWGDVEKPYVMGGVHNWKTQPDSKWLDKQNNTKAIRTRSGNTIELIDEQGKEQIIIYQKDKEKAHHISLMGGGDQSMTIYSKGKLIIEAESIDMKSRSGAIDIKSQTSVGVKGTTDVMIEGVNITVKSSAQLDLQGGTNTNVIATAALNATANGKACLNGGALTEILGALVKIN